MNGFLALGFALIGGAFCGKLMNRIKMPTVTGYILAGLFLGGSVLRLITEQTITDLGFISDFALCIIAFTIGSELEFRIIARLGKAIFSIAFFEALFAFILVGLATWLISGDMALALILGAVSSATAPAATVLVLRELQAKGDVTSTLLGVIAVDDALCLMIYAVASAVARVLVAGGALQAADVLLYPLREILLSVLAGALAGLLLAWLLSISRRDSESMLFLVGTLLTLVGVTTWAHLSTLLAAMATGIAVTNLSRKKKTAFQDIDRISPPIIAGFFVLAGSRLDLRLLPQIGLLGLAYFVLRIAGKLAGAALGGKLAGAPANVRKYLGLGLLSQVGVAVGLAITVSREFPGTSLGTVVVTILLATTILTEIIGPYTTRYAITRAGESRSE